MHYDEVEPCFVDEVSRSAVKYFCESFGLLRNASASSADTEAAPVVGHVKELLEREVQHLRQRRQAVQDILALAKCTADEMYSALHGAFPGRKFFLSFDAFNDALEEKFHLTERSEELSTAAVRNTVVAAFEAFDSFKTQFVTLVDIQLVLLRPDQQREFHANLRRVDVRTLNRGIDETEMEFLQEQKLPEGSATLFYHLLQR